MASGTDGLPPYQEKPSSVKETVAPCDTPRRMAGQVQTCSLKDGQIDYFSIVRDSDSTFHLSLTVDPTPLYHIKLVPEPNKVGNIQILTDPNDASTAVAAVFMSTDPAGKALPVVRACTSSPTDPNATWRVMKGSKSFLTGPSYRDQIPVVAVPGRPAKLQDFEWSVADRNEGFYRLFWKGPLPNQPSWVVKEENAGMGHIFATVACKPDDGETVVEIRRGGGIEFELSVILGMFVSVQVAGKMKDI